jgi:regulating synaptic membrane exocytosis protein 2
LIERRSRRDMSPQGRKRVAGMVSRDYQTVSGVGGTQTYPHQVRISSHGYLKTIILNQSVSFQSQIQRRGEPISMSHRSQSAAPSDYRGERRGSLSPPDDRYLPGSKDYPVLPLQQQQSFTPKFQSRSATATPTGSPKKRQLPKVPQISRNTAIRDRLMQDFEDRSGGGRRHRGGRQHHMPQYRSTGQGGLFKDFKLVFNLNLKFAILRMGKTLFWTFRQ